MLVFGKISAGDASGLGAPDVDIVLHLGSSTLLMSVNQAEETISALKRALAEITDKAKHIVDVSDQSPSS